jgi:hypothetical protein
MAKDGAATTRRKSKVGQQTSMAAWPGRALTMLSAVVGAGADSSGAARAGTTGRQKPATIRHPGKCRSRSSPPISLATTGIVATPPPLELYWRHTVGLQLAEIVLHARRGKWVDRRGHADAGESESAGTARCLMRDRTRRGTQAPSSEAPAQDARPPCGYRVRCAVSNRATYCNRNPPPAISTPRGQLGGADVHRQGVQGVP